MFRSFIIKTVITLTIMSVFFCSCTKDLPVVTTTNITDITATSAISGGDVTDNGGSEVTERGVCWGTDQNPETDLNKTSDGNGNGSFTSSLTGLTADTRYYVRAYATNSEGISYGNEVSFTTGKLTMTDADGNNYSTVKIGSQVWTKENLRTTKFKNGNTISLVSDGTSWSNLNTPAYCWYNNNEGTYKNTYGALYNWNAVNTGNLCPEGWHVPSDAEWTVLTDRLGGMESAGGKMKEAGNAHWLIFTGISATNESGFSGLPGAYRDRAGDFYQTIGHYGFWWSSTSVSSTNAWDRGLYYDKNSVSRGDGWIRNGISVRCLKN
jgi:uncharacterized protein (TIGR02145 family)